MIKIRQHSVGSEWKIKSVDTKNTKQAIYLRNLLRFFYILFNGRLRIETNLTKKAKGKILRQLVKKFEELKWIIKKYLIYLQKVKEKPKQSEEHENRKESKLILTLKT